MGLEDNFSHLVMTLTEGRSSRKNHQSKESTNKTPRGGGGLTMAVEGKP